MSFLVDAPWLFANGEAYARLAPESAQGGRARVAAAGALAAFLGVGVSLYSNARFTRPLWPLLPGRDGRDFMVNFPGLRVDTRRAGLQMHAIAALLFACYPLWFWLGWSHGRRASRPPPDRFRPTSS